MSIDGLIKRGNYKLPKSTIIFNLGSATNCPNREICQAGDKCYALKAERMYPNVLPYRTRQAHYWQNNSQEEIIKDFSAWIKRRRKPVEKLRLNEAGDFKTQNDVLKAEELARALKERFDIATYTYTSSRHLDFTITNYLVVLASGEPIVGCAGQFIMVENEEGVPDDGAICPGDCRVCSRCSKGLTTYVLKH